MYNFVRICSNPLFEYSTRVSFVSKDTDFILVQTSMTSILVKVPNIGKHLELIVSSSDPIKIYIQNLTYSQIFQIIQNSETKYCNQILDQIVDYFKYIAMSDLRFQLVEESTHSFLLSKTLDYKNVSETFYILYKNATRVAQFSSRVGTENEERLTVPDYRIFELLDAIKDQERYWKCQIDNEEIFERDSEDVEEDPEPKDLLSQLQNQQFLELVRIF